MTPKDTELRDWFAGQAIVGAASCPGSHLLAADAYALADAMMAERQKGMPEADIPQV